MKRRLLCIRLRDDHRAVADLARWCESFSPQVGVEEALFPGSLLLDVTRTARFFGGEVALARAVLDTLVQRGLGVDVAIADTPGAAWAMAAGGSSGSGGSCEIVPPGATAEAMRPLPLAVLRLPEATEKLLHALGVHQVGQIEALPRGSLRSRFGPELLRRLDEVLGRASEVVPACPPPKDFSVQRWLFDPTAHPDVLEQFLRDAVAALGEQLLQHDRGALRLECRWMLEDSRSEQEPIVVGLFQPTASSRHLFELIWLQWQKTRLSSPVAGLRLEATATALLEDRQRELFSDEVGCPRQPLARLIDRLGGRLGSRAVLGARPVHDAQPESAYRCHPLVDRFGRRRPRHAPIPHDLPPRPLRLFRRPIPLPWPREPARDPPGHFPFPLPFEGRTHRLARTWGPERIETGWWRGPSVRRDYYRAETTTGQRFWLFCRLGDGRWFLHGVFD